MKLVFYFYSTALTGVKFNASTFKKQNWFKKIILKSHHTGQCYGSDTNMYHSLNVNCDLDF